VPELSDTGECPPVRVGAVAYLNARPLNFCIRRLDPGVRLIVDLPSRLADGLAAGRLDVAMIPSIEYFRNPGYTIVSDACVACHGAVRSVRLYGRVAAERIRTLALDEGSRTSAALVRILLKERFNLEPQIERLPVGASVEDSAADAVLLIGDRAMLPPPGRFAFVWDMGEEWSRWTGLPFVFAMWIARHRGNGQDVDLRRVGRLLAAARDEGVKRFVEIARAAAPALGVPEGECLSYLRDNLDFWLGPRQREGLARFCELAGRHGLAPAGAELVFDDHQLAR
jgi:chorismate dehydratase